MISYIVRERQYLNPDKVFYFQKDQRSTIPQVQEYSRSWLSMRLKMCTAQLEEIVWVSRATQEKCVCHVTCACICYRFIFLNWSMILNGNSFYNPAARHLSINPSNMLRFLNPFSDEVNIEEIVSAQMNCEANYLRPKAYTIC